MVIKKAIYNKSVVNTQDILTDGLPEFAFVGRSNVGKSTLINSLVGQRIAKASSTPGKTRMINYFDINDSFRFVDLPGYGYAKVGKGQLDVWSSLMGDYLTKSTALLNVFLLLDVRHLPTDDDLQMIKFLVYYRLPFSIIVTKVDKIAKSRLRQSVQALAKATGLREEIFIPCSMMGNVGREEILNIIENKLELAGEGN